MLPDKKNLQDAYANLPQDLKDALYSIDFAKTIQTIGTDQGLLIDQTGKLAEEIGFVMLGITHPDKFADAIARKLSIPTDKATAITKEVNEKIFLSIRASLQKIHSGEGIGEDDSDASVGAPTEASEQNADMRQETVRVNLTQTSPDFDHIPSRESVLAGIEDPKSIENANPINALAPKPPLNNLPQTPLTKTVFANEKTAPAPVNLPTAPVGILESKLQSVVKSENPTPKHDPYREPIE